MKRSGERADLDTLEADIPTTKDDTAALRRVRFQPVSGEEYLAFLARFGHAPREVLAARPLLTGEPFVLGAPRSAIPEG